MVAYSVIYLCLKENICYSCQWMNSKLKSKVSLKNKTKKMSVFKVSMAKWPIVASRAENMVYACVMVCIFAYN